MVVQGSRPLNAPPDPRRVPANVTVITREEIQRAGARTVPEVLQRVPGIGIFEDTFGGNRLQQTLQMRGFSGLPQSEVSVFVDGVPANANDFVVPQTGIASVPLDAVERIEIIPGPGAVYGRNALGGVINIVTRRGGEKHVGVGEVAGGSFNTKRFAGAINGPLPGGFDYYLSAKRDTEDGPRDFSDGRLTFAYGKLGYHLGEETDIAFAYTRTESNLKYALQITPEELARDRTTSANHSEAGELVNLFGATVRQRLPWGFSLALNGFRRARALEFTLGLRAGGNLDNKTETSSGGGGIQLTHAAGGGAVQHQITTGADYRRDDSNSRTAGQAGVTPFVARVATDQSLLQDGMGVYVQEALDLFEQVSLTAGLRYDRTLMHFVDRLVLPNTTLRRHERATPRAGVTYTPMKGLLLFTSFAEGFRPPTSFEIFGVTATQANARLGGVPSRTVEAGLRGSVGSWLEGSAAAFTTRTRNEIFIDPLTLTPFHFPVTRRRGIELSLRPRYGDVADGFITLTLTDATFRTNLARRDPRTGLPASIQEGELIPHVPKHRVNAGVNVRPATGLAFSLAGQYVGRQVVEGDFLNKEQRLKPYFVLNAKTTYAYRGFTFFVQGKDILDQRYELLGFFDNLTNPPPPRLFLIPAPGWSVEAGMSYRYELPF